MDKGIDTGFKDKSGKAIHVDDIIQHRLGKFGKSGGPTNLKVIQFGKKYQVVQESEQDLRFGGRPLSDTFCEYVVVINCMHMPR